MKQQISRLVSVSFSRGRVYPVRLVEGALMNEGREVLFIVDHLNEEVLLRDAVPEHMRLQVLAEAERFGRDTMPRGKPEKRYLLLSAELAATQPDRLQCPHCPKSYYRVNRTDLARHIYEEHVPIWNEAWRRACEIHAALAERNKEIDSPNEGRVKR